MPLPVIDWTPQPVAVPVGRKSDAVRPCGTWEKRAVKVTVEALVSSELALRPKETRPGPEGVAPDVTCFEYSVVAPSRLVAVTTARWRLPTSPAATV